MKVDTKNREKPIDKRKTALQISLAAISAFFLFFRLFSLLYSFLRKLKEWAYTEDYKSMNTITIVIWVVIVTFSLLFGLLIYVLILKLEKRFEIHANEAVKATYIKRLLFVSIIAAIATISFNFVYFFREYNLTDYISKSFGTITALAYDLLDWTLFNFIMFSGILALVSCLFVYTYSGFNRNNYKKSLMKIAFTSIIILIVWEITSLGLFYWINTFTIETWFA